MKLSERMKGNLSLDPCSITELDEFIRMHYLHRRPGVVTLALKVKFGHEPYGAVVFGMPPAQTHKRYGGLTWELARLFLLGTAVPHSESCVIAHAVKYVRCHFPEVKCLVSYADPSAGHRGVIYKAANWISDGRTDDERKTPRCDYQDADGKHYSRRAHIPEGVNFVRIPRVSKYRFIYRLCAD